MTPCMFVTLFARKGPLPNWYLDPPLLRTLRSPVGVFYGRDPSLAPWEQAWGFECPPPLVSLPITPQVCCLWTSERTLPSVLRPGAATQPPLLLPSSFLCSSLFLSFSPVSLPISFPCFIFSPKSQISPGWKNLPSDPVLVPGVDAAASPGRARLLWDAVVCPAGLHLRPRVIFERE